MLIAVAVVLGAILLLKGGMVGFDSDSSGVDIGSGSDRAAAPSSTAPTTAAPPSAVAPAQVKVVAANGTTINGFAGKAAEYMATQGYTQVTKTQATAPATATTVYWAAGFEGNARAIATALGLPASQVQQLAPGQQVAQTQDATTGVAVVLGPDVQGKLTGAATTTVAGGNTATTTVAGGGTATTIPGKTTTTAAGKATTTAKP